MKPRLIIFTKAPVIGGAKSRLAKGIGKTPAWRIYRAMTAGLVRRLRDPRWELVLAVAPDRAWRRRFPKVWPGDVTRLRQGSGDLGARQARVLRRRGPVCVIGSDAPQVTRSDIAEAFKALKRSDGVVGPAEDGGYWLLALNAPAPSGLFKSVRWSHPQTLGDLTERMSACGLARVKRLRALRDVDEAGDVERVKKERRG